MAYSNSNLPFEKMLMKFLSQDDPMLSMLQWLCEKLMEAEVDSKLAAQKSQRTLDRQGYPFGIPCTSLRYTHGYHVFNGSKNPKWRVYTQLLS